MRHAWQQPFHAYQHGPTHSHRSSARQRELSVGNHTEPPQRALGRGRNHNHAPAPALPAQNGPRATHGPGKPGGLPSLPLFCLRTRSSSCVQEMDEPDPWRNLGNASPTAPDPAHAGVIRLRSPTRMDLDEVNRPNRWGEALELRARTGGTRASILRAYRAAQ